MRFLLCLLMVLFPASSMAQSPLGLFGPRPNSKLYENLIGMSNSRESSEARIWTDDYQTVTIQIVFEGCVFRFIGNDSGLQEVWMCELVAKNKPQEYPMKKIIKHNELQMHFAENEVRELNGVTTQIRVVIIPASSPEGRDLLWQWRFLTNALKLPEEVPK